MHIYDKASESAFFRHNRFKMSPICRDSHPLVNGPTDHDFEWAKKAYRTKRENLFDAKDPNTYPTSLWQLAFLWKIPEHGILQKHGLDPTQKRALMHWALESHNINAVAISRQYSHKTLNRQAIRHAVINCSEDFITQLSETFPNDFKTACHKGSDIYQQAMLKKNLNVFKLIAQHKPNIVQHAKQDAHFARSQGAEEIANYIENTIIKAAKERKENHTVTRSKSQKLKLKPRL